MYIGLWIKCVGFVIFTLFFKNRAYLNSFYASSEFGGNSINVVLKGCSLGNIISVSWKLVINADFQIIHPSARVPESKDRSREAIRSPSAHQGWKAFAITISSWLGFVWYLLLLAVYSNSSSHSPRPTDVSHKSHTAKDVEFTVFFIQQFSVLLYNTNCVCKIYTGKIALFSLDEWTLKMWHGFSGYSFPWTSLSVVQSVGSESRLRAWIKTELQPCSAIFLGFDQVIEPFVPEFLTEKVSYNDYFVKVLSTRKTKCNTY